MIILSGNNNNNNNNNNIEIQILKIITITIQHLMYSGHDGSVLSGEIHHCILIIIFIIIQYNKKTNHNLKTY